MLSTRAGSRILKSFRGLPDRAAGFTSNVFSCFIVCSLSRVVSSKCDSLVSYECANRAYIPWIRFNDTVNDCGDNSDEGIMYGCSFIGKLIVKAAPSAPYMLKLGY